jgi:hypothetical protein
MGWASGSELMSAVIWAVSAELPDQPVTRWRIYVELINAFDSHDWDTQTECLGIDPEFDAALYHIHPKYRAEE